MPEERTDPDAGSDAQAEIDDVDTTVETDAGDDLPLTAEADIEAPVAAELPVEEAPIEPIVPEELAPIEFDTTPLEFVPNDPAADFDTTALEALEPVDATDPVPIDEVPEPYDGMAPEEDTPVDTVAGDTVPLGGTAVETLPLDPVPLDGAADESLPLDIVPVDPALADVADMAADDTQWLEADFDASSDELGWAESTSDEHDGEQLDVEAELDGEDATIYELAPAEPETATIDWPEGDDAPIADVIEPQFDSVATADAIEDELQDLFALDQVDDSADVVPLHASSDDFPEAVVGLDDAFDPDAEAEPLHQWVGVGDDAPEDPWAYMRPDEGSEAKSGFWASRPKFFGGDERKRRKAARKAAEAEPVEVAGPTCPNCGEEGRVDLDDPVGGKVHASCNSCDHVWSESYDPEQRSA